MMTNDELLDLFHARSGVICAVGAGGKKSTLYTLLSRHPGRVGLTATVFTKEFPAELGLVTLIDDEQNLLSRLADLPDARKIGFAAPSSKPGRYAGLNPALVSELHKRAGLDATFVKADGARMRWVKAPREGEPVIPADCTTVIALMSALALDNVLSEKIAHRIELITRITGLKPGDKIKTEHMARLMVSDAGLLKNTNGRTVVPVINMVDDTRCESLAREAAEIALGLTDRFDRVVLARMQRPGDPVVAVVERRPVEN